MLKESMSAVIDYLYNACEVSLVLEIIRDSLSPENIRRVYWSWQI